MSMIVEVPIETEVISDNLQSEEVIIEPDFETNTELQEDITELSKKVESVQSSIDSLSNETVSFNGENYNELQLLAEILTTMQQEETVTNDQDIKSLIEAQNQLIVEGSFAVVLSVIISFAVYMFFNQLSKW